MLRIQQTVGSDKPQIHTDNGVNSARQELDSINADIKKEQTTLEILASDVVSKQDDIVLLSKEKSVLEIDVITLKNEISELNSQKTELIGLMDRYNNDIRRLSGAAYEQKEKFIADSSNNQVLLDEITAKIAKKTIELSTMESTFTKQVESRSIRLKDLDNEISIKENHAKSVASIIDGKNNDLSTLNVTMDGLTAKKRDLESEVSSLLVEKEDSLKNLRDIDAKKQVLIVEIDNLSAEFRSLQANVTAHRLINDNLDKREEAVKAMEVELQVKHQKFLKQHVNNN